MLFVFLVLYVVLAVACTVAGSRVRSRRAVICGVVAISLAAASLIVWILLQLGATHWTISVLQFLLSPMPESLLEPAVVAAGSPGGGFPLMLVSVVELVCAIVLWAVPIGGLVVAGRARTRARGRAGVRN